MIRSTKSILRGAAAAKSPAAGPPCIHARRIALPCGVLAGLIAPTVSYASGPMQSRLSGLRDCASQLPSAALAGKLRGCDLGLVAAAGSGGSTSRLQPFG